MGDARHDRSGGILQGVKSARNDLEGGQSNQGDGVKEETPTDQEGVFGRKLPSLEQNRHKGLAQHHEQNGEGQAKKEDGTQGRADELAHGGPILLGGEGGEGGKGGHTQRLADDAVGHEGDAKGSLEGDNTGGRQRPCQKGGGNGVQIAKRKS